MNDKRQKFFQSLSYLSSNITEVSQKERVFRTDNGYVGSDSAGKDGRDVIYIGKLNQEPESIVREHLRNAIKEIRGSITTKKK